MKAYTKCCCCFMNFVNTICKRMRKLFEAQTYEHQLAESFNYNEVITGFAIKNLRQVFL